jgi:NAD(P)-dependent dehydrogenase (short-subunit alcohol dehydrogenase family)
MATVLVTGAGTGIGRLTALTLARGGHDVYASMREPEGRNAARARDLREQAPNLNIVELDVLSQESADRAVAEVVAASGGIDVVVHNAAHLYFGVTEAFSAEEVMRALDVNVVGAVRVNRAALPAMRERGSGLLVWVGSGITRAIPAFLGPYSAGKAAFDAYAESTAWDVAVYGIETTIVMPGVFTEGTEHFAQAEGPADTERAAQYTRLRPFLQSSGDDTRRLFPDGTVADPQIVADEIARIVSLQPGTRPRRTVADGSDYGAELVNGAAEELRLRLARRMHLGALLEVAPAVPRAESPG